MKKLLVFTISILCATPLFAQTGTSNNSQKNIGIIKTTTGDRMMSVYDIVKNISQENQLSVFASLIQRANLTETLQSKGPLTLFAPVDSAFNNLEPGMLDSLHKPAHVWELTHILTYHIIPGNLKARDIEKQINAGKGQATFTTLAGDKLTAKVDGNRNIVLTDGNGGQSIISRFDIEQSNGTMHIITKVLIPKAKVI